MNDARAVEGGYTTQSMAYSGGTMGANGAYGSNMGANGAYGSNMAGAGYNGAYAGSMGTGMAGNGAYGGNIGGGGGMNGGMGVGGAPFGPGGTMTANGAYGAGGGPMVGPGGVGPGGPGMGVGPGSASGSFNAGGPTPPNVIMGPPATGDACGCGPPATAGDCAGSCGGMETMCCEAGGSVSSLQWMPVGTGGNYNAMTSYQYAGEGCGNYERQVVTTYYGWRVRKCCLALLGLLLLAGLLYLLSSLTGGGDEPPPATPAPIVVITTPAPAPVPTPAPTTPAPTPAPTPPPTTPAPVGPLATCLIFGDPHVKTFDGQRADYYTAGEYWVVKSDTVWVQGRYLPTHMTKTLSVTKEIAIGGPFIGSHKLVVGVDVVTYDGAPVMSDFNKFESWSNNDKDFPITLEYNAQGTVMQASRVGKALHVVHVKAPRGVTLEINRWQEPTEGHYINTRLTMPAQPGIDGHCGNFNNIPTDDTRVSVRDRVGTKGVDVSQMLFAGPKTPINPGNRPDLNDCPEGALKIAMDDCKAAEGAFFPSTACLVDHCLGHMQTRQV